MRHATLLIVLVVSAGLAHAQDLPKRKSGLWEITRTTTRTEGRTVVMRWCVDSATDNALKQLAEGVANETCSVKKSQRDGDKLVVDAVCTLGPEHAVGKTHAVITGKFDSAYRIESKSSYDPAMRGKTDGTARMDAKWVGACKAGQRPGDVLLPNGVMVSSTDEPRPDDSMRTKKDGSKRRGSDPSYVPADKRATPTPQ